MSGLAGAAALIAAVTVVSRLLGFVRSLVFSSAVGLTGIGGAYNAANTIPNVLFEVAAGGALAGALIPVIAAPLARGMREDVSRISSAMLTWTLSGLVLIGGLLAVFAEPVAALTASNSDPELVVYFLRVFAVQIPLYGLAVVLAGVLQAQKRFFWPAFVPVLSSLVVIATYAGYGWFLRRDGLPVTADPGQLPSGAIELLAWGTTAGVLAMGVPLLVPVLRSGVRLRASYRFPAGVGTRALNLALAGLGGLVAQQVSVLAVLKLVDVYGTGPTLVAWQTLIQPVYLLPYAVLAVPLATSTFPRLAERASRPGREGFARLTAVTTRGVLTASTVGVVALVAAAPAVTTVFGRIGNGDAELLAALSLPLSLTAPGLLGFGLVFHVSRALYALERGRLAVIGASTGWAVVIAASWIGCVLLVGGGHTDGPATLRALAIGNSIGMLTAGVLLLVLLRRAAGAEAVHGLARSAVVLVLGGAAGALLGRLVVDALATPGVAGAVLAAVAGAVAGTVVLLAAVWLADRSAITGLLRRGRTVEG
ncbi:virulence factor MviN [Cellulomonas denverensis]|uniref:Virulence factor MviN n=2 Tax=Cellulomonas denverensis TaxID=264297 RepID=A0A7X6KU64_9CELL|nr:lipid II flippase MurJ [Cellulomonas denverensis]NKY22366.1 virulence factor MviN [Cellulomonas denverensis]